MLGTKAIWAMNDCLTTDHGDWDRKCPEARLWAVCLSQAISGALGMKHQADFDSWSGADWHWLMRSESEGVGSCAWICEHLNIDRRWLREFIVKHRHELRRDPYRLRNKVVYIYDRPAPGTN